MSLTSKMKGLLREFTQLKYIHLCIALLLFYAGTFWVTYPSNLERVTDALRRYCYTDYWVRSALFEETIREAKFYRERYRERLESLLGAPLSDLKKSELQTFFKRGGLLYEVFRENRQNSYLLAEIVEEGRYKSEIPEGVDFSYLTLGKKKILTFSEFRERENVSPFVSVGDNVAYIHQDIIESHLQWYFESLWQSDTSSPKGFYLEWGSRKDLYTYFLYRDLQEVCEHLFGKRFLRDKKMAKRYFVEEGIRVYLPTLLAMAGRMVADQGLGLRSDLKYLRACLTGLSNHPKFLIFYLLKTKSPHSFDPLVRKGWEELKASFDLTCPEGITLEEISRVSKRILDKIDSQFLRQAKERS